MTLAGIFQPSRDTNAGLNQERSGPCQKIGIDPSLQPFGFLSGEDRVCRCRRKADQIAFDNLIWPRLDTHNWPHQH